MRHGISFRRLGRNTSQLRALLRTLTTQLVEHERIVTTKQKAYEASRVADKLITWAKKSTPGSYSQIQSWVMKPAVIPKLMTTLRERYLHRPGGYTRVLLHGFRPTDKADRAILEFVDNPWPPLHYYGLKTPKEKLRTPEELVEEFVQKVERGETYVPGTILDRKALQRKADKAKRLAEHDPNKPVVWKKPAPLPTNKPKPNKRLKLLRKQQRQAQQLEQQQDSVTRRLPEADATRGDRSDVLPKVTARVQQARHSGAGDKTSTSATTMSKDSSRRLSGTTDTTV